MSHLLRRTQGPSSLTTSIFHQTLLFRWIAHIALDISWKWILCPVVKKRRYFGPYLQSFVLPANSLSLDDSSGRRHFFKKKQILTHFFVESNRVFFCFSVFCILLQKRWWWLRRHSCAICRVSVTVWRRLHWKGLDSRTQCLRS